MAPYPTEMTESRPEILAGWRDLCATSRTQESGKARRRFSWFRGDEKPPKRFAVRQKMLDIPLIAYNALYI